MPRELDAIQQLYSLNFAASAISGFVGSERNLRETIFTDLVVPLKLGVENRFQVALNKTLAAQLPGWTLNWGPRVWKNGDLNKVLWTGADNVWFAATYSALKYPDGTTFDTCVVAIGGTSEWSSYDWLHEDFAVTQAWMNFISPINQMLNVISEVGHAISGMEFNLGDWENQGTPGRPSRGGPGHLLFYRYCDWRL